MKTHLTRSIKTAATALAIGWSTLVLPATAVAEDSIPKSPPTDAAVDASTAEAERGKAVLVDLNRASVEELDALPRVGPAVAARVIAYREQNGGFRNVEELLNVRGIGDKTFERLRPQITVGGSGKGEADDKAESKPATAPRATPDRASK